MAARPKEARYRAGQTAPAAGAHDDEAGEADAPFAKTAPTLKLASEGAVLKKGGGAPGAAPIVAGMVLKKAQPVAAAGPAAPAKEDAAEAAARRRAAAIAKMRERKSESSSESDKEGAARKAGAQPKGAGAAAAQPDELSESSQESESALSSSSSSSSEYVAAPLLRPVFVSKEARTTVKDAAQEQAECDEQERVEQAEAVRRVADSKALLERTVADAKAAAMAQPAAQLPPETIDDGDETEEYELWRVRELRRMQREQEERREWANQRAAVERRRQMSDAEVMAEDADKSRQPKAKLGFLQRYYHKGAFYQDELKEKYEDEVFNAPTGVDSDIRDKSLLPSVMQVRSKWGLKGRTKYTHLTDQDTTVRDTSYGRGFDDEVRNRIESKRGGMKPLPSAQPVKKHKQ